MNKVLLVTGGSRGIGAAIVRPMVARQLMVVRGTCCGLVQGQPAFFHGCRSGDVQHYWQRAMLVWCRARGVPWQVPVMPPRSRMPIAMPGCTPIPVSFPIVR